MLVEERIAKHHLSNPVTGRNNCTLSAFIFGHTSGGFPYGLTWEEWDAIEEAEELEMLFDDDELDQEGPEGE